VVHKVVVCGAAGFIPKSASKDALMQAIRNVLAGEVTLPVTYLPPNMVTTEELAGLTCRLRSLTQKQLRVLQMLCQGLLNKQIAHELDVCETTVKAHVSEILRKLSVCSRTQAVLEVSKLNLNAVLALYADEDAGCPIPITH
jgi:DNA-binding NarL/FixJ family response regulator